MWAGVCAAEEILQAFPLCRFFIFAAATMVLQCQSFRQW
jgi:hypothetical protein